MKYKSKTFDFNTKEYDKLSISQLKRQADYWLRQSLLNEVGNSDYIFCPIKERKYHKSQMEVAHYIDRGYSMWTRYNEMNCKLISKQSNSFDAQIIVEGYKSKHHKEYTEYLLTEFGQKYIDDLHRVAGNKNLFTREDYIQTIEKFRGNE
jgi:hypothetical protein